MHVHSDLSHSEKNGKGSKGPKDSNFGIVQFSWFLQNFFLNAMPELNCNHKCHCVLWSDETKWTIFHIIDMFGEKGDCTQNKEPEMNLV